MDIILKPKHLTIFFACIIICLTLVHSIVQYFYITHGSESIFEPLTPFIDFNAEHNIPTFYSSASLLFCSVLLTIITVAKKKSGERYIYWLGLVAIFLFLSIDEFVMIHDRLNATLRSTLNVSGFLHFAWIIPYGIALIIFVFVYTKFVFNLPFRVRFLFIIAGSIYVSGAIGFEPIEGKFSELYGYNNVAYVVLYTIEEIFEMAGIVVFIYALTSYIGSEFKGLRLSIKSSN
ncbi:MAG: hypothetical protein H8D23_32070 [Candidatus Brocadiales bacterium]|nr:hypothetical protein [Candidatus Brocadiales bacterium]